MKKSIFLLLVLFPFVALAQQKSFHQDHEFVDLGLSVKWATCNVGADSPDEYGDYFAWGETQPKSYYSWSNYKYWEQGAGFFGNYMKKYCYNQVDGNVDRKSVLDKNDDAASTNWGGNWRTPTKYELFELRDSCKWEEEISDDVRGYRVTGPNGNSIFIPNAAYILGSIHGDRGDKVTLWSSSLNRNVSSKAYLLETYELDIDYERYLGCPIRPVLE
jgi:hypothetical protein